MMEKRDTSSFFFFEGAEVLTPVSPFEYATAIELYANTTRYYGAGL